ncbi:MAG: HDIG domain-containing protein [Nanoarchaeota archaeon]|nr:HDIG domain-containing protein [Nanoarchaeota archaeon]
MKRLIKLAERIEDKELRKKTLDLLKDPQISNKSMKYPRAKLETVHSWAGAHHDYDGGLLDHILSVTEISISIAETFNKIYKKKINLDHVIAGALLHDIMKVFMIKKGGKGLTGTKLDHAVFSAAELYSRGFPEEVVDIVASHGGESAQPNIRTIESFIVYQADVIDSAGESSFIHPQASPFQFMLMGDEKDES